MISARSYAWVPRIALALLYLLGLLLYWPAAALAPAIAAIYNYPRSAVLMALVIDIAYGAPSLPRLQFVELPFTLGILLLIGLRYLAVTFFGTQENL